MKRDRFSRIPSSTTFDLKFVKMTANRKKSQDPQDVIRGLVWKWALLPAFIAIISIAAFGVILTTLGLQNGLPKWVYGAPSIPAVLIYYYIHLRHLWHKEIQPGITANVGGQIGNQRVAAGGVAPVIKGKGHTTNIYVQVPPRTEGKGRP